MEEDMLSTWRCKITQGSEAHQVSALISHEIGRTPPHARGCYFHLHNFIKFWGGKGLRAIFFLCNMNTCRQICQEQYVPKHTYCKNSLGFIQNVKSSSAGI